KNINLINIICDIYNIIPIYIFILKMLLHLIARISLFFPLNSFSVLAPIAMKLTKIAITIIEAASFETLIPTNLMRLETAGIINFCHFDIIQSAHSARSRIPCKLDSKVKAPPRIPNHVHMECLNACIIDRYAPSRIRPTYMLFMSMEVTSCILVIYANRKFSLISLQT
ncbi:hypothetical protein C072_02086, partial [Brucella abortus 863/67]